MSNDFSMFKPGHVSEKEWNVTTVLAGRIHVGMAVKVDFGHIRGWGTVTDKTDTHINVKMDDGKNETAVFSNFPVMISPQDLTTIEKADLDAAEAERIRVMKAAMVAAAVELEERKAAQDVEAKSEAGEEPKTDE